MKSLFKKLWLTPPKNILNSVKRKLSLNQNLPHYDYSLEYILESQKHMHTVSLIDRWERYWRVINNNSREKNLKNNFNFKDKKILELGCGPLFGWGPIAIFHGANQYYYREPALKREVTLSKILKEKYFFPLYKELICEYPINLSFEEYYHKLKSSCLPMDFNGNSNLDIVLSNSVLEHIFIKDLNSLLSKIYNSCKDKALFIHIVDFGSHGKGGSGFGSLYKENRNKPNQILNLLRKNDIEKYLINNGFTMIDSIVYRSETVDRKQIHYTWTEYSDIDLNAKTVLFIGGIE